MTLLADLDNNHWANINRLVRFMSRQQAGYMFACFPHPTVMLTVNAQLAEKLQHVGLSAAIIQIDTHSDHSVANQLEQHQEDVLIVINLGDWVTISEAGFHSGSSDRLSVINFARETLLAIGKPILFWISKTNLAIVSNRAADLYSQRAINTVFFEDMEQLGPGAITSSMPELRLLEAKPDAVDQQLKINLLRKQLEDGQQYNYPHATLAGEVAIPLAELLALTGKKAEALQLAGAWSALIDTSNPERVLKLANTYFHAGEIGQAIGVLEDALKQNLNWLPGQQTDVWFKLAEWYKKSGQLHQALENYQQAAQWVEEWLQSYPEDRNLQFNRAVIEGRIAEVSYALGFADNAFNSFARSKSLMQQLTNAEPDSILFKKGLFMSISIETAFSLETRMPELSLQLTADQLSLAKEIYDIDREDVTSITLLASAHNDFGAANYLIGNIEEALLNYLKHFNLLDKAETLVVDQVEILNGKALGATNIGTAKALLGVFDQAKDWLLKAVKFSEQALELKPDEVDSINNLATANALLGIQYSELMGQKEKGIQYLLKSKVIFEDILRRSPENQVIRGRLEVLEAHLRKARSSPDATL